MTSIGGPSGSAPPKTLKIDETCSISWPTYESSVTVDSMSGIETMYKTSHSRSWEYSIETVESQPVGDSLPGFRRLISEDGFTRSSSTTISMSREKLQFNLRNHPSRLRLKNTTSFSKPSKTPHPDSRGKATMSIEVQFEFSMTSNDSDDIESGDSPDPSKRNVEEKASKFQRALSFGGEDMQIMEVQKYASNRPPAHLREVTRIDEFDELDAYLDRGFDITDKLFESLSDLLYSSVDQPSDFDGYRRAFNDVLQMENDIASTITGTTIISAGQTCPTVSTFCGRDRDPMLSLTCSLKPVGSAFANDEKVLFAGYLDKRGDWVPAYRKRFVILLTSGHLKYYTDHICDEKRGEIRIVKNKVRFDFNGNYFSIHCKDMIWRFYNENAKKIADWKEAFERITRYYDMPMRYERKTVDTISEFRHRRDSKMSYRSQTHVNGLCEGCVIIKHGAWGSWKYRFYTLDDRGKIRIFRDANAATVEESFNVRNLYWQTFKNSWNAWPAGMRTIKEGRQLALAFADHASRTTFQRELARTRTVSYYEDASY